MAVFPFSFLLIFTILSCVNCQFTEYNRPISLVLAEDCNPNADPPQFYDISKLACVDCSQNNSFQQVSTDGLSCECKRGLRYTLNHGGVAVTCVACPINQVASSTGYNCVSCGGNGVNNVTNTCNYCPDSQHITTERDLTGNWNPLNTVTCTACTSDTQPSADKSRCVKCTNNIPVSGDNTCACDTANNENIGGFCIPSSELINAPSANELYVVPRTTEIASPLFEYNLRAAYALCKPPLSRNITACQVLANLCVLTLYEYNALNTGTLTTACELYFSLVRAESSFSPDNVPWLYYVSQGGEKIDGDDILFDDYLQTQYTFSPTSMLDFRVARYSLDGKYLGLSTVLNGRLQLCADTAKRLNAAYVFGTTYKQTCKIAAIDLWDRAVFPLEFMDPYLEISQNGEAELYPIPVNVLNYRSLRDSSDEINRGDPADQQLFRRFFLVDNVATVDPEPGKPEDIVRYAATITINVQLQTDTTEGIIYPPAIQVDYKTISRADADAGQEVDISFTVDYSYTDTSYLRDFQIAVGTLSTLGVIFAGYRTWVWSKRSGRPTIDFPTIANFFFYCCGTLSNVFFVITFGMAFYWLIFFKRQSVVYLIHPADSQLKDWTGLFGAAFALKLLEVGHMIVMQCMVDVFFIDWERSRGVVGTAADSTKAKEVPVSIWRTYFVANEWNEIQAVRKINKTFQVWAVVFFLVVVGFENTATRDPDGSVTKDSSDYKAEYSRVYRYAVAVLVYLVIGIVQWIFYVFVYERFFEDKVRQFVDLCSMSNISVFVMAHAQYGHYIHGRSVHGRSDTNMKEMFEMMKKEEEDMCGTRGLLANTEQQTFIMALPKKLRIKYEQVLIPAQIEVDSSSSDSRMLRMFGDSKHKTHNFRDYLPNCCIDVYDDVEKSTCCYGFCKYLFFCYCFCHLPIKIYKCLIKIYKCLIKPVCHCCYVKKTGLVDCLKWYGFWNFCKCMKYSMCALCALCGKGCISIGHCCYGFLTCCLICVTQLCQICTICDCDCDVAAYCTPPNKTRNNRKHSVTDVNNVQIHAGISAVDFIDSIAVKTSQAMDTDSANGQENVERDGDVYRNEMNYDYTSDEYDSFSSGYSARSKPDAVYNDGTDMLSQVHSKAATPQFADYYNEEIVHLDDPEMATPEYATYCNESHVHPKSDMKGKSGLNEICGNKISVHAEVHKTELYYTDKEKVNATSKPDIKYESNDDMYSSDQTVREYEENNHDVTELGQAYQNVYRNTAVWTDSGKSDSVITETKHHNDNDVHSDSRVYDTDWTDGSSSYTSNTYNKAEGESSPTQANNSADIYNINDNTNNCAEKANFNVQFPQNKNDFQNTNDDTGLENESIHVNIETANQKTEAKIIANNNCTVSGNENNNAANVSKEGSSAALGSNQSTDVSDEDYSGAGDSNGDDVNEDYKTIEEKDDEISTYNSIKDVRSLDSLTANEYDSYETDYSGEDNDVNNTETADGDDDSTSNQTEEFYDKITKNFDYGSDDYDTVLESMSESSTTTNSSASWETVLTFSTIDSGKAKKILSKSDESAAAASRMDGGRGGRIAGTAMEKQVEAYSTINRFLSAFIDRSLRDIDYVIKDKTFLESIMDTEFYDTQETGIFYNDDGHSFDNVLFYGNEMTLLLFDILAFCITDLIFTNYIIAGVVTYLLSELICKIRDAGGEKNLARKTLVDERFLI